jgi:CRISPR-associated endonuclease/helicase Cas3
MVCSGRYDREQTMSEPSLSAADFPAFFEALWSKSPFPWQSALAKHVVTESVAAWPEAITLPTASGKTACLDIALFALAAQAERQAQGLALSAPRRIFFVVDRRVIVDEAFERARCVASKLELARDGILKGVADRLRRLAGGRDEPPLACFQLRGGIYRDDAWARSPIQPTIVCSTVDQVGSRLLFRAYGRSFKAWHLQAGLVGNDSLILLDEAHCAQPFMETLQSVARYRQWSESALPSPFRLVVMTATPPEGVARFPDAATERANRSHPLLKRRIEASKPCRLEVAAKAHGRDAAKVNQALAQQLVADANRLVEAWNASAPVDDLFSVTGAPAVSIFCNRVDTARRAHTLLAQQHGDRAILLTGRMRPIDRDDTLSGPLAELSADQSEQRRLERPWFVVSTQTLEVGANLDFDLMVSECADLSALRQRFGRLNRMGRRVDTHGVICVRADQQQADSEADPVYGNALSATWIWLQAQRDETGLVDFGISAFERFDQTDLASLATHGVHAPVMLPAHLDALVQTAPVPCPSPEVSLFLHGPQAGPADVQVCWRADLQLDRERPGEHEGDWIEAVAACPPSSGELMPVPFVAFRRWLAGESNEADRGDVEGAEPEPEPTDARLSRAVLRWRGLDDSTLVTDHTAIRPGDVIVVPACLKGWENFGHMPNGAPADLGDRANRTARATAVLRLHPSTLAQWPDTSTDSDATPKAVLLALLKESDQRLEEDPDVFIDALKDALRTLSKDTGTPPWLAELADALGRDSKLIRGVTRYGAGGLILKGSHRFPVAPETRSSFSHEDDATASGSVSRPVPLSAHLNGVRDFAQRFTRHLPELLAQDIQLAAWLHDLGKADPRFQDLLQGGNPWMQGELLAKSANLPQGRRAFNQALRRSGYPPHARHELLSVRLVESAPAILAGAHDPDLVLHLIASHHGHCRPFAPVVEDTEPRMVSVEHEGQVLTASSATGLERIESGVADRFWRLVRRYGWWGLAELESMMMLSDHRRSEWEGNNPAGDHP